MEKIELYNECSGVDEHNDGKSAVSVEMIWQHTDGRECKPVMDFYLDYPVVNIFDNGVMTMIDLRFESYADIDFMQVAVGLMEFTKEYSADEEHIPVIALTIVPKMLLGNHVVSALLGMWTVVPSKPNVLPDTIRFIFMNEHVSVLEISDDELERAEMEMEDE